MTDDKPCCDWCAEHPDRKDECDGSDELVGQFSKPEHDDEPAYVPTYRDFDVRVVVKKECVHKLPLRKALGKVAKFVHKQGATDEQKVAERAQYLAELEKARTVTRGYVEYVSLTEQEKLELFS